MPPTDASFRLRTLFIVTATCAAAFAVLARWPYSIASPMVACVPTTWLIVGLCKLDMALGEMPGGWRNLLQVPLTLAICVLIVTEAIALTAGPLVWYALRQSSPP